MIKHRPKPDHLIGVAPSHFVELPVLTSVLSSKKKCCKKYKKGKKACSKCPRRVD